MKHFNIGYKQTPKEDICKKMGIFKDCEIKDVEHCKKCIIKYFRKKYK